MYSLGTFSFGTRPTEARSTTWAKWGVGAWAENLSTRLAVLRRDALPRLIATWRNTKTLTQSSSTSAVLTGMTFPIGGWIHFILKTIIGTWGVHQDQLFQHFKIKSCVDLWDVSMNAMCSDMCPLNANEARMWECYLNKAHLIGQAS